MRIVKEAEARKSEILDAAGALFMQKGYDATTISDIINKLGVARGLVYYHFKSKEDILDALLERTFVEYVSAANKISKDKSIPVLERLFKTLAAMHAQNGGEVIKAMNEQLHKPQNALMHDKTRKLMMVRIPPILDDILRDGIAEGLFDTPYTYESVEMIVAHVVTVLDDDAVYLPQSQYRSAAFIFNLERLLGAKPGSLEQINKLLRD